MSNTDTSPIFFASASSSTVISAPPLKNHDAILRVGLLASVRAVLDVRPVLEAPKTPSIGAPHCLQNSRPVSQWSGASPSDGCCLTLLLGEVGSSDHVEYR